MKRKKSDRLELRPLTQIPGSIASYAMEYLEWMAVKNYSRNTIHTRMNYLSYFAAWADQHGLTTPFEITKPILERYQRYLYHYRKKQNKAPLSFRSQCARMVGVRSFFKWMARQNYMLYNPASDIELPKMEKRLPHNVLTAAEAEQVINQANPYEPLGIRDRTMMEVFYSTGMRRMEIINLKIYDLDSDRGTVIIKQGKGKKDRMVPIGQRAINWAHKYLADVRPKLVQPPDDGTMFLTAQGEAFVPGRLTQLVRSYVDAANIDKKGSCHLFRHACATLMLENGADIRFIQQLLGHANLDTTEIYTQVSIRKLREIHKATHPADLRKPLDLNDIAEQLSSE